MPPEAPGSSTGSGTGDASSIRSSPRSKTDFLLHALVGGDRLAFKRSRKAGECWYLVAMTWWKAFAGKDQRFRCGDDLPVLDNSPLLCEGGELRQGLVQGLHFEAIPAEVYLQLKAVFPAQLASSDVVCRHTTADGQIEVYLLECKIELVNDATQERLGECTAYFGKETTLGELCRELEATVAGGGEVRGVKLLRRNTDLVELSLPLMANTSLELLGFSLKNNRLVVDVAAAGSTTSCKLPRLSSSSSSVITHRPPPLPLQQQQLVLPPGLRGLMNIGNSCYLNAVLQCLSHTGPLRALLLAEKSFQERVNPANALGRQGEAVRALHHVFRNLWQQPRSGGSSNIISPSSFKAALDTWTPAFRGFHQHDAHELLQFVLDLVHEDTASGASSPSTPSLCQQVFGGSLRREVVCPECKHCAQAQPEPFHVLSLPLAHSHILFVPLLLLVQQKKTRRRRRKGGGTIRYIRVQAKSDALIARELEARLKTQVIVRNGVAYEAPSPSGVDGNGGQYVFGHHELASTGQRLGQPFHFYLADPANAREDDVKRLLCSSQRWGDDYAAVCGAFDLCVLPPDALVVRWRSLDAFSSRVPHPPTATTAKQRRHFDVRELLHRFCAEETMEGDNLWFCDGCKEKRAHATTRYSFAQLPDVLVLHLKRFSNSLNKITDPVRAPTRNLRLSSSSSYSLFAVLRHHGGSVTQGHYDAQVLHCADNQWYTANDSCVTPVLFPFRGRMLAGAPPALDSSAYMYFYRKEQ